MLIESPFPQHAIISSQHIQTWHFAAALCKQHSPLVLFWICAVNHVCAWFSLHLDSHPPHRPPTIQSPFFFLPFLHAKPAHNSANRALLCPNGMALSKGSGLCSLNWERSLVLCLFSRFCPSLRCWGYSVWGGRFFSVSPCNLPIKPRCIWG